MSDYMNERQSSSQHASRYAPERSARTVQQPTSSMAIAGLVLGILALLTSFIPFINNGSFFLALLGLIFSIVGFVGILRGKRSGKGLTIAAIVLNVIAAIVVLVTQSAYSRAIDDAISEVQVSGISSSGQAVSPSTNLRIGSAVTLDNGLVVTLERVEGGFAQYDGTPVSALIVSYRNTGNENVAFNSWDWKVQNSNGVLTDQTVYFGDDVPESLGSGQLIPGGSAQGAIFFEGDIVSALYYSNIFNSNAQATWQIA